MVCFIKNSVLLESKINKRVHCGNRCTLVFLNTFKTVQNGQQGWLLIGYAPLNEDGVSDFKFDS